MPSRNATPSPVKLNIGKFKSDVSLWTNTNHRLSDNIIIEEDPEGTEIVAKLADLSLQ